MYREVDFISHFPLLLGGVKTYFVSEIELVGTPENPWRFAKSSALAFVPLTTTTSRVSAAGPTSSSNGFRQDREGTDTLLTAYFHRQ